VTLAHSKVGLAGKGVVRNFYRVKATTMTLSEKRQSVFPQDWCERVGLARGGPVNVFDLGDEGLLIRPVKPPTDVEVERLLDSTPAGRHSPEQAAAIVKRAFLKTRT
jgi:bifunctional DNA-binding transcriptional regulator/antitoxin component of YhaV-PrlF toxin-antitoxin module